MGMLPPTQYPWLDLMKTGQGDAKLNFTTGQLLDLLTRMPDAFTDQLSSKFVEPDTDVVFALG